MKKSWVLRLLLLVAIVVTINFLAVIWMQFEFLFAGDLSAADLHSIVSGVGFWSLQHLFFHVWKIVQALGFLGLILGVTELFVWFETGMQDLRAVWQKETPFLLVGHERVLRR